MAASFSIKNPNLKSQSCYPHQAQVGINLYLFTSFHSVACFVWKPAHLEFPSYDGAWQRLLNAFVEKYILTVLRHLQIRNTACVDPSFSRIESATNTQSFPLNSSKFVFAMIYQPTSSATRNMKSRLAIKFPTPFWVVIKCPPSRQEKASNAQGMPEGDVEASIWLVL